PPDTTITSPPPGPTLSTASFAFTATELSTFECRLDGGAFIPCSSPVTYSGFVAGSHAFEVRATDLAGNLDATPAKAVFSYSVPVSTPPAAITCEAENGNGAGTIMSRSLASGGRTAWLHAGESRNCDVSISLAGRYTIDVRYSNDNLPGPTESIEIRVDGA